MAVRNEDMAHFLPGNARVPQLAQNAVAAARIDQQIPITAREQVAAVVAFHGLCISRAKSDQFHLWPRQTSSTVSSSPFPESANGRLLPAVSEYRTRAGRRHLASLRCRRRRGRWMPAFPRVRLPDPQWKYC